MREKYIFKQKLMCYLEEKRISKEGKLVFYANMKKTWGQENYKKYSKQKRNKGLKRVSTHKLSIEKGRYEKSQKKIGYVLVVITPK